MAEKTWNPKANSQGNQNGSKETKKSLHVQRIVGESTQVEYNPTKSPHSSMRMNRYAELTRNCKK